MLKPPSVSVSAGRPLISCPLCLPGPASLSVVVVVLLVVGAAVVLFACWSAAAAVSSLCAHCLHSTLCHQCISRSVCLSVMTPVFYTVEVVNITEEFSYVPLSFLNLVAFHSTPFHFSQSDFLSSSTVSPPCLVETLGGIALVEGTVHTFL